jgi:hypothetical protein
MCNESSKIKDMSDALGRTENQIMYRRNQLETRYSERFTVLSSRQNHYTHEEDQIILTRVYENENGTLKKRELWESLERELPGRTAKGIQQRWKDHLIHRYAEYVRDREARRTRS